jgi:uncharacterized protein (TIGR02118 family)
MGLLNKHEDWSMERFRTYWREQHSKLASQLPGLLGYHQNHVIDSVQRGITYKRGPESVDGISQLWFDDSKKMDDAFSQALGKKLIDDENYFIDHLRIITAEPTEVIAPHRSVKRSNVCLSCAAVQMFLPRVLLTSGVLSTLSWFRHCLGYWATGKT